MGRAYLNRRERRSSSRFCRESAGLGAANGALQLVRLAFLAG